jgi:hypothetical protein
VLPSALGALRTVKSNASHEGEVQRAMEMVGERFAVLHSEAVSEATAARVAGTPPENGGASAGDELGSAGSGPATDGENGGVREPEEDTGSPREGARLGAGPLV